MSAQSHAGRSFPRVTDCGWKASQVKSHLAHAGGALRLVATRHESQSEMGSLLGRLGHSSNGGGGGPLLLLPPITP